MKSDLPLLRITIATAAALLTTGCGNRANQASQICTDGGGRRVPDSQCLRSGGGGSGGYRFYYLGSGSYIPAVGERASGGSFRPMSGVSYARGAVTRGGFGSRAGIGGRGS